MVFWRKKRAATGNLGVNKLEAAARLDRMGEWPVFGTQLAMVERIMAVKIAQRVGREIKKRGSSREKPYKVLDLGCGPGTTLEGLKQQFGDRVKTAGLVVERTIGCKYDGVDEVMAGMHNLGGKYDFVFSYIGTTFYHPDKEAIIRKAAELLEPGGIAALDFGEIQLDRTDIARIKEALARQGIRHFRFAERKSKKYLDIWFYSLFFKKPAKRLEK